MGKGIVLVVVVACGAVIPIWRHVTKPESGGDSVGHASGRRDLVPPEDRVRLRTGPEAPAHGAGTIDRPQVVVLNADPAQSVPRDETSNAEDGHLHQAMSQPEAQRAAPPSPPRPSVDPEPQAPDDPRDFELPKH